MIPVSPALLAGVGIVLLASCVGLALLTVVTKVHRARRAASRERQLAPVRMALMAVAAGEDPDGVQLEQLYAVPPRLRDELQTAVVALITKVRGAPVDDLVSILRHHEATNRAERRLTSRRVVPRARAARLLGLVGDTAYVPSLVRLLEDPSAEVRIVAARALGAVGDPRAAAAVLRSVRSSDQGRPRVPATVAADALIAMGLGAAAAVVEALEDRDPGVRNVAATVTSHSLLRPAAAQLRRLLGTDPDPVVRAGAARAIGRMGGPDDVPALLAATAASEAVGLRRTAAQALGELGHRGAVPGLVHLLGDGDRRLAEVSGQSLGRLGPPGLDALRTAAEGAGLAGRAAHTAVALHALRTGVEEAVR